MFISRISKEKNLIYALRTLCQVSTPLRFDIYGPITDQYVWEKCQQEIRRMPAHIKVSYRGALKKSVRSTFRQYDLFFFPTVGENFGHVIAESLASGTPVLVSDKTPWSYLEAANLGWDFSLDDLIILWWPFTRWRRRRKSERRISKEALGAWLEDWNGVARRRRRMKASTLAEEFESVLRR